MPAAFYTGATGVDPVDHVIRGVLDTAHCHHIERLMIVGNIMLLCDLAPDTVYQWFLELFIDADNWLMVPRVYRMSQSGDGGGDDHQALHQRRQLRVENERIQEVAVVCGE